MLQKHKPKTFADTELNFDVLAAEGYSKFIV